MRSVLAQNRRPRWPATRCGVGEGPSKAARLASRQAVADAQHRLYAALAIRRQSQLLADVANVGLEQVGVALIVVAPGVLDQAAVRDDPPFVQCQHVEDAELEPRQLHGLAS